MALRAVAFTALSLIILDGCVERSQYDAMKRQLEEADAALERQKANVEKTSIKQADTNLRVTE